MSLSHGDTVQEDELNRHASLSQGISLQAQSTETYQSVFGNDTTDNHKASPNHDHDHGSFGAPLCSSEEIQKSSMKISEHNSILDTSKAADMKNTAAASPLSYLRQSPLKVASDSFKGLFHRPDIEKPEKSNSRSAPNSPTTDAPTKLPSLSSIHEQFEVPDFSMLSKAGVELEAKQMSAKLPDDFIVDSCKLSEEFVSASIIPGRRGKEIGKGATATVKIMYRKGSGKVPYAVKEFRRHSQDETAEEYEKKVKSEFSIANSLHHPNIVQTVRLCTHSGRWNHVMEYCSQGELFSLVQKQYLQSKDIMCLFRQLLQGVSYLHSNGIAHRDIKLENLLLTEASHLKIIDFGVSEVFSGLHPGLSSSNGECGMDLGEVRKCAPGICGSLPYIAPEVMARNGDYDPRPLDVWSCAIVCVAMLSCGTPWQTAERKDPQFSRFTEGWNNFMKDKPDGLIPDGPVNPSDLPPCGKIFSDISNKLLQRLILRMLHPDPEKRFTISDVMNDQLVKKIECCCPEPYSMPTCYEQIGDRQVPKVHRHLPPVKKGVFSCHY